MGIPSCSKVLLPASTSTGLPMNTLWRVRYIIIIMAIHTARSSSHADGILSSLFREWVMQGTHLFFWGRRLAHSSLHGVVNALQS